MSGDDKQVVPRSLGLKRWEQQMEWVIKDKNLGEGGFSTVREGVNRVNHKRVAIKVCASECKRKSFVLPSNDSSSLQTPTA